MSIILSNSKLIEGYFKAFQASSSGKGKKVEKKDVQAMIEVALLGDGAIDAYELTAISKFERRFRIYPPGDTYKIYESIRASQERLKTISSPHQKTDTNFTDKVYFARLLVNSIRQLDDLKRFDRILKKFPELLEPAGRALSNSGIVNNIPKDLRPLTHTLAHGGSVNFDAWATANSPSLPLPARALLISIATFDSGFGGFFTAKAIEKEAHLLSGQYDVNFNIMHFGDTANAPYGEKTPDQITEFATQGILKAFQYGAQKVFIACNTASTQHDRIKENLDRAQKGLGSRTISIIESSVEEMKSQILERFKTKNVVNVAIFATPATVKDAAYPKALARAFKVNYPEPSLESFEQNRWYKVKGDKINSVNSYFTLELPENHKINIYQVAPANWVDMIEHAAPRSAQITQVRSDLDTLTASWRKSKKLGAPFDVVGEFCTHYPVFDHLIQNNARKLGLTNQKTNYIKQGPLMAGLFRRLMNQELTIADRRAKPLNALERKSQVSVTREKIFISGSNIKETRDLAKTIWPLDPTPDVNTLSFENTSIWPH